MSRSQHLPELLLPAGSFDSAIAAIEGGADALYFGFSDYSARRQARNFDRLEYRRLRRYATEKGIRLYATLNTILVQEELEAVCDLLAFVSRFPPDAILVQDWGLARLIRDRHPGLTLHASTQTAIQGPDAARMAMELGVSRVVLPRETSLQTMREVHEALPGLELEAFVHGALCYSYSGLCLASGLVLGRSGNRGECAQLCRSYYDLDEGSSPSASRRGYWFSCRDLEVGESIRELAQAGISSLKVEGRMKSPEYCFSVARLYRGYLDSLGASGPGKDELEERALRARVAFSRSPTKAWLYERGGSQLIDPRFPGHRGVSAGTILDVKSGRILVQLTAQLSLHDGLMVYGHREGEGLDESLRFSALGLKDSNSGRDLVHARSGSRVFLDIPQPNPEEARNYRPHSGDELRLISSRDADRRSPSPEEYEAERDSLSVQLSFGEAGLAAEVSLPRFDGSSSAGLLHLMPGESLPLDRAKNPGGFQRALLLFSEAGDADFRLNPAYAPEQLVRLPSGDALSLDQLFIPPSVMKKEKNRLYAEAAEKIAEAQDRYVSESRKYIDASSAFPAVESRTESAVPPRSLLVFPRAELSRGMPFATLRDLKSNQPLPCYQGAYYLPLAPLVLDFPLYKRLVLDRIGKELAEGHRLVLGLGALHHVALARELDAGLRTGQLSFFLDFSLYIANSLSYRAFSSLLPQLSFAYAYMEMGSALASKAGLPVFPVDEAFEAPLFQSLGCLKKHHAEGGRCPADCSRSWTAVLSDRDRGYTALVEDCVSFLFRR